MAPPTAVMSRWWTHGRKVVAIGRNYRLHAQELNNEVPTAPFWFLKPTSSYVRAGSPIVIPDRLEELHHETELGVVIGTPGRRIPASSAMEHVAGYCLALDMTARQWQAAAKAKGLPWTAAKGFDTSLPVGDFIDKGAVADPHALTLWCAVNGDMRQRGSTSGMLFSVPQLIAAVSAVHTLEAGDLILTGTPEGVGPVRRGDVITAGIEGHDAAGVSFNVE
eukprot:jgi/Tetstr1/446828/TSEL_034308.t1